ncbi:rhodanese-like domain-containing protein 6 isoform X2 [Cryptomeria japonica]|uniref:rhodanese-like domain-containing protein 6 isoform X2 n=1 Tax=Cryptomeria japonica TaxID=3369 RepID=UPI0027DA93B1|nr:rhodanese-like domain-containing protein 6 isoform X2 [Cryptomeria japonica]
MVMELLLIQISFLLTCLTTCCSTMERCRMEVVSLVAHPLVRSPSISNAGKHLSAIEFHSILQMAGGMLQEDCDLNRYDLNNSLDFLASQLECETGDRQHHEGFVLLDARNMYETRIGKFLPPGQVQTLVPKIRQYSDLPAWIDSHAEQLCGNNILMYCTGGVRCEMASAYIRMKGSGYENVYQLSGGIQRYLEAYPNGGFFKGKNFVFDPRISVGSTDMRVIGSCLLCGESFDDYSSRSRCSYCRMLVLVCNTCQELSTLNKENRTYLCELCCKNGPNMSKHCGESNANILNGRSRIEEVEFVTMMEHDSVELAHGLEQSVEPCRPDEFIGGRMGAPVIKGPSTRKLKILCLHGFRQNASSLKGRLASFGKKLKHLADFVFVDAPHEVPFIYQTFRNQTSNGRDNDETLEGSTNSVNYSQTKLSLPQNCKKKFAWLVVPNCYNTNFASCPANMTFESRTSAQELLEQDTSKSEEMKWIEATSPFDPLQYQQQSAGWPETVSHLQNIFADMGPFDGVLGFSQGASVAATLCTQLQNNPGIYDDIDFKFVILCSGFPSPAETFQQFISNPGFLPIDCPSLHIFGGNAALDRQIMSDTSMQLASLFRSDCRVVVKHSSGHIVPAQSPYIDRIKEFLTQFL